MLHLSEGILTLLNEISWLSAHASEPRQVPLFGPFLGRSLLELSTTALVGRLDPFRVLVVQKTQAQPKYDPSTRWKVAIQWQGDVIAERPERSDGLWSDKIEYSKITRSLLGDYYDELVWQPAIQQLQSRSPTGGAWLADLLVGEASSFAPKRRSELSRLYSTLSKGVHHEFLQPPGAKYDRSTIADTLQRTVHSIADLSLLSHFVSHAAFVVDQSLAIECYNRIEKWEIFK